MRHFSAWVLLLGLLLGSAARGWAQGAAFGDWRLHLPAQHPTMLAEAGNRLYVADESSFYFYDKTSNSTQQLSRRDGLSDVGVAALAYDSASAQLVVAYRNGNIDLVSNTGAVRNITDLLRKDTQTAKTVNQIQIYGGVAYLSTTLGVLVLDLAKREVRDTYSAIGPGGLAINALATVVLHDTIFVASQNYTLLRGRLSAAVNLLDYRSWTTEVPVPSKPGQIFRAATAYRGHLYVASQYQGVEYLAGTGASRAWRNMAGSFGTEDPRLRTSAVGLLFAFRDADLRRFDPATRQVAAVLPAAAIGRVVDVVRTTDGTYFVASTTYDGLLRFGPSVTTNPEVIKPNAPATTDAVSLLANAATNTVDIFIGGFKDNTTGLDRRGFYEYQNGQWTNYTAANFSATEFPNLADLTRGTRTSDGTLYIASYGNGLLEWKGPGQFKQYTAGAGSLLRSSLPASASNTLDYVRVTDVAADPNNGNVWVLNRHQFANVPGLLRLHPRTGTWDAVPAYSGFENLSRVAIDDFGNPWATQARNGGTGAGVVAYDTTARTPYFFTTLSGLPSNSLYAIARDRSGDMWVGTAAGVATCSPGLLATNGTASNYFATPVVRQGTGSGYPALYSEAVTCIAIDGANRKWFGTTNGLWLFNDKASEALLHFTTTNSPLPSNTIIDVAVNDKTGEVFVATSGGVVSYQGSATITEGKPSCAQVFPNPVRPDFAGTVGINSIVNNGLVKITDVAGHLVYSTRAAGGTVTWNLADTDGRRVRSGVYLVLTSDAEGKNTCVSKVAVLSK